MVKKGSDLAKETPPFCSIHLIAVDVTDVTLPFGYQ